LSAHDGGDDDAIIARRPSFVGLPRPALCAVITEVTPDAAIRTMRNSEFDGADAFLFDLRKLDRAFHTSEQLASIFLSTDKPVMVYYYRRPVRGFEPVSDEVRAETFLACVEAGASAVDIMADLFDPNDLELSRHPEAVERQRDLMERIRSLGGEPMLSSHTLVPMTTEAVVAHVKELVERGPDMVKIVPRVETEDDLLEAMRTTVALRNAVDLPFIHIVMGEYNRIHRIIGPTLGSAVCFCVPYYAEDATLEQPLLRATRQVFDNFVWRNPRSVVEQATKVIPADTSYEIDQ
jgi:3-dehydroquinate dehydratase